MLVRYSIVELLMVFEVSAQREHTIVCLLFMLHFVVGTIMHGYNTVEHSTTGDNNCTGALTIVRR